MFSKINNQKLDITKNNYQILNQTIKHDRENSVNTHNFLEYTVDIPVKEKSIQFEIIHQVKNFRSFNTNKIKNI